MSFLSIAFLMALPLAAAPIVLHLIDRRRSVVIEWGAMQFLQEAATRKTSARRVQHWLLLMLRVTAVAALVLALSRPLLPGNWFGTSGRRETIFVIDTSMSTLRTSEGQPLSSELISRAGSMLDALESGGAVRILASSPYPVWVTPASVRIDGASRLDLHERLSNLRPTLGTSDLLAALLKAVQSDLADEALAERHIVLLTDGQRTDWRTDDAGGWTRFREALAGARVPTSIEVVEAAAEATTKGNVAVNEVRASRTVVGVDQPLTVTAAAMNHSEQTSSACRVIWSVGETNRQESQLPALEAGQTHDLVWRHSFNEPGVFRITCRAEADDNLPTDNEASIVVEAVEHIPIVVVEGAEGLAEMQQDAYLVQAALGRVEGDAAHDWRAVFDPHVISPERLDAIDLDEYRAVVIPNLSTLTGRTVERLRQLVEDGGGFWVAIGPRTDVREFNRLLFNEGDGLSPVAIDQAVDESPDDARQTTINPFLKDHPATAGLADEQQLDLGDVKVTRRFRFRIPAAADQLSVLLDLTDGDPLAVENRVGRGRVIVQAVPLRMQWSELASSQAFVVMVHNWLGYLTEPGATRHNLLPGDPISLHVASSAHADAVLTTPSGADIALTGEPLADGVAFRTSRTILPGNYSLEVGLSGDGIPFHVARDPAESDLASLTTADRSFLADKAGLNLGRTASRIAAANHRDPIWPLLLVLLIAVICGELVLSGSIAIERFGTEPIPESAEPWALPDRLFPGEPVPKSAQPASSPLHESQPVQV